MSLSRPALRRLLAVVVAGFTVLALLTGNLATAMAEVHSMPPRMPSGHRTEAFRTVTLITGDVVKVFDVGGGRQAAEVTRPHAAPGGVRAETVGKDLYVLPDEVLPYLAAGVLDRRLFDVTGLLEQGYGDQHSDGIPLIVSRETTRPATFAAEPAVPTGATRVRELPSINGTALRAPKKQARDVWRSLTQSPTPATMSITPTVSFGQGIAKVWLDGRVRASLAESTAQVGAPAAWDAGFTGAGVTVAVLDTGADLAHPDLAGQVTKAVSFVPGESASDGNGHGTHTASTVAGTGAASGGVERGVAPGANLIVGKVLSDNGFGEDSWVIAGMEWAAGQGADVISMSLGGWDPSDGTDPMSIAVNELTAATGALFVIAAGNTGMEAMLSAPGAADAALTVGAVDAADQLASFSTMGPRYGDYGLKPDLSAPGVDILAARNGGSEDGEYYQLMSGTSMATPHVAGAAAILAQQHPTWSPSQLKDALMSTSRPVPYTAYQVGAGRLDVAASVAASVTATGSAYFGFQGWPHTDGPPVDRTITYTNASDASVTLTLAEQATVAGGPYDVDPGADAGTPAPEELFTLATTTVTVPAHGSASVVATAHPELGQHGRRYLGQVVATDQGGSVKARTQLGLYLEDERHTVHISLRDRAGNPSAGFVQFQMFGVAGDPILVVVDESGEVDVRLRAATYSAFSYLDVAGSHGPDSVGMALLGDPELVLDRDRSLNLDARQAREVTAEVPRKTEDRALYLNWFRSDGGESVVAVQYLLPAAYDTMFALPTAKVTKGSFEFETRWRKAYPFLTVTNDGAEVPLIGQAGTSLYDGTDRLEAVAVGTGSSAEYAGRSVAGKAVLVTRSDQLTGSQRAAAAATAGAKLLIVVNDGPGKLLEWVGPDEGGYSKVPVASVTARVGASLLAAAGRGRLRLTVVGVPNSPFVYDLDFPHPGQVPTDLSYRPRANELAKVDMVFHGTTGYEGGEFRWDFRPHRIYSFGFLHRVQMPGTRVDYVSAQPGTAWAESAVSGPDMSLVSSALVHSYAAGSRSVDRWFGPVVRPRNGGGFWSSTRYDGFVAINVQPWADGGGGHAGYLVQGDSLTMKVYENGTLVSTTNGWASANLWPVPPDQITYTLDLEASRDPAVWRLSPRTHTVWTVVSKPVGADGLDLMPLLQLDYQVDTNLAGDARVGRQRIGLAASHLDGAVGAGKITGAALAISVDDGVTWRPIDLRRSGDSWVATFEAPKSGFVSLQATAWDDAGNKIIQEVVRAYGLSAPGKPGRGSQEH